MGRYKRGIKQFRAPSLQNGPEPESPNSRSSLQLPLHFDVATADDDDGGNSASGGTKDVTPKTLRARWKQGLALAAVLLLGLGVGSRWLSNSDSLPELASTAEEDVAEDVPLTTSEIYATILPSVVYIEVHSNTDSIEGNAIEGDAIAEESDSSTRVGTGVVITIEGHILTALHVVQDAELIEVVFADGTTSTASIDSQDPSSDIATLLPANLPSVIVPAVLGSTAPISIGDQVVAVGHPLGLVGSATEGILSGADRTVPTSDSEIVLEGLLQFDAAVNPGSSGGPLVNSKAEVIGIVTAIANPSEQGFFVGIGFAIPIGAAAGGGGPGGEGPTQ